MDELKKEFFEMEEHQQSLKFVLFFCFFLIFFLFVSFPFKIQFICLIPFRKYKKIQKKNSHNEVKLLKKFSDIQAKEISNHTQILRMSEKLAKEKKERELDEKIWKKRVADRLVIYIYLYL